MLVCMCVCGGVGVSGREGLKGMCVGDGKQRVGEDIKLMG